MNRQTLLVSAIALLSPFVALAQDKPNAAPAPHTAIARIWRGRTPASKADEYARYLDANGIAKIRATPGNRGVTVLRRTDGEKAEFVVISIWDSIDAVKNFAGADYQKTVILPRARVPHRSGAGRAALRDRERRSVESRKIGWFSKFLPLPAGEGRGEGALVIL